MDDATPLRSIDDLRDVPNLQSIDVVIFCSHAADINR